MQRVVDPSTLFYFQASLPHQGIGSKHGIPFQAPICRLANMVASSSFTAASAIDGVRGAALLGVGFSRLARTSSCEPALHPGQPAMHLPVCTVAADQLFC